jgi:hypothetical protein
VVEIYHGHYYISNVIDKSKTVESRALKIKGYSKISNQFLLHTENDNYGLVHGFKVCGVCWPLVRMMPQAETTFIPACDLVELSR